MKGSITIRCNEQENLTIDMRMERVSKMDAFIIMDGLAEAFNFNEEQRIRLGAILAVGGFKVITGKNPVTMRMDTSFLDLLNKKKDGSDEG